MGEVIDTKSGDVSSHAAASYKSRSRFVAPPEEFEGCFTTFYLFEIDIDGGGTVHDYLQPEWGNIRFFAGEAPTAKIGKTIVSDSKFIATGPSSLANEFQAGSARMWGIGFLPLGWARFVNIDASKLANVMIDGCEHPAFAKFNSLSEILCDPSANEDDQIAAISSTMRELMRPNRDEAKIKRVHHALLDVELTSVAEFADRVGMSTRTLERICGRYFGFPPKLLMRRQRFMRSLTTFLLHQNSNWTEVMDENYHDQAHFTREFREFMTMNPSEYAALDHPILSSFMEARARVWGSPAQTLDKPAD